MYGKSNKQPGRTSLGLLISIILLYISFAVSYWLFREMYSINHSALISYQNLINGKLNQENNNRKEGLCL